MTYIKRIAAGATFLFIFSMFTSAQTADATKTVCKGAAIPEGYTIIGEAESGECANKAWVIKKRATPRMSMQQIEAPVSQPAADRTVTVEGPVSAGESSEAMDFAKRAFELLSQGDLAVEDMIDWDNLKLNGRDFGSVIKQASATAGKDFSAVRKEMIAAFSMQYKNAGESALTNWRVQSKNDEGTIIAATESKGQTVQFTVSVRNGKQIITALSESK